MSQASEPNDGTVFGAYRRITENGETLVIHSGRPGEWIESLDFEEVRP